MANSNELVLAIMLLTVEYFGHNVCDNSLFMSHAFLSIIYKCKCNCKQDL